MLALSSSELRQNWLTWTYGVFVAHSERWDGDSGSEITVLLEVPVSTHKHVGCAVCTQFHLQPRSLISSIIFSPLKPLKRSTCTYITYRCISVLQPVSSPSNSIHSFSPSSFLPSVSPIASPVHINNTQIEIRLITITPGPVTLTLVPVCEQNSDGSFLQGRRQEMETSIMDFIHSVIKSLFVCTHNSLHTYLFAGGSQSLLSDWGSRQNVQVVSQMKWDASRRCFSTLCFSFVYL